MSRKTPLMKHIKEEPEDNINDKISRTVARQVLVNFGPCRKKVFQLDGGYALAEQFKNHVKSDPAFSELLTESYPVFQEFNTKFGTWVDIDCDESLKDGAVVKVVFSPKIIETNLIKPVSRKRKRSECELEPKHHESNLENVNACSCSSNVCGQCDGTNNVLLKQNISSDLSQSLQHDNNCNGIQNVSSRRFTSCDSSETVLQNNSLDTKGNEIVNVSPKVPIAGECSYQIPQKKNCDKNSNRHKEDVPEKFISKKCSQLTLPKHTVGLKKGRKQKQKEKRLQKTQAVKSENGSFTMKQENNSSHITAVNVQPLTCNKSHPVSHQNVTTRYVTPVPRITSLKLTKGPEKNEERKVATSNIQPVHRETDNQFAQGYKVSEPARKYETSQRRFIWCGIISEAVRQRRMLWGQMNVGKIWWNTIFSGVAMFVLEGNYIRYISNHNTSPPGELFWGCRSFDGPNIIVPMGVSLKAPVFCEILNKRVIKPVKAHFKNSDVTLQFLSDLRTQYISNSVRSILHSNLIKPVEWPTCVRDMSPLGRAWRLVGEKVRTVHCSSKEEMISVVSQIWENDMDVQSMCSKYITLLPEIINSLIKEGGRHPRIYATYEVTK